MLVKEGVLSLYEAGSKVSVYKKHYLFVFDDILVKLHYPSYVLTSNICVTSARHEEAER